MTVDQVRKMLRSLMKALGEFGAKQNLPLPDSLRAAGGGGESSSSAPRPSSAPVRGSRASNGSTQTAATGSGNSKLVGSDHSALGSSQSAQSRGSVGQLAENGLPGWLSRPA